VGGVVDGHEESEGRADNLLARPLRRSRWLLGHLAVASTLIVGAGVAAGVGGWAGLESQGGDISLGSMLLAGINVAIPGLVALGLGTLLFGLFPRIAVATLYVLVLWSLLIATIGSGITENHWLLDTAVLTHLGPVPAANPHWTAITVLLTITAAAIGAGIIAFNRRDLTSG
jgi:polyether ionophore transport system permease protein